MIKVRNWLIAFIVIFIAEYLLKFSITLPSFEKLGCVLKEIIIPFIVLIGIVLILIERKLEEDAFELPMEVE